MPDVKTLYDEDFYAWSKDQSEALRSAAQARSNLKLDWENLAEEIESLGRSERRELASRLSQVIQHLVKLARSPAVDPRRGWRETIMRERLEIERILEDSPSLRRELPRLVEQETGRAIDVAINVLKTNGEFKSSGQRPAAYTADQIVGDWFPPEPQR
jgi:Domain of unknown function DUF29